MNLSRKQFAQFAQISLVAATAMAAATATAATRTKCKYLPQNIWQNIAEERQPEPGLEFVAVRGPLPLPLSMPMQSVSCSMHRI